jgi:hypothetical protein
MDLVIAKALVNVDDNDTLELYEDYSGRGMYGSETAGIVTESIGSLISAAIYLTQEITENPDDFSFNVDDVAYAMKHLRSDGMGRYSMIYY